jgi:hypothetical protein
MNTIITIGNRYIFRYVGRPATSPGSDLAVELRAFDGATVTVATEVCKTTHGTLYEARTEDGTVVAAYADELHEGAAQ